MLLRHYQQGENVSKVTGARCRNDATFLPALIVSFGRNTTDATISSLTNGRCTYVKPILLRHFFPRTRHNGARFGGAPYSRALFMKRFLLHARESTFFFFRFHLPATIPYHNNILLNAATRIHCHTHLVWYPLNTHAYTIHTYVII